MRWRFRHLGVFIKVAISPPRGVGTLMKDGTLFKDTKYLCEQTRLLGYPKRAASGGKEEAGEQQRRQGSEEESQQGRRRGRRGRNPRREERRSRGQGLAGPCDARRFGEAGPARYILLNLIEFY